MPRLQSDLVRVGRRRDALQLRHLHHVVGVVGAGAIDRRRPQHGREQLGLGHRLALELALGRARGGLLQRALRRRPVVENVHHAGIGGLARQRGRVEQLVIDHHSRARAFGGLIGHQLVARHFLFAPLENADWTRPGETLAVNLYMTAWALSAPCNRKFKLEKVQAASARRRSGALFLGESKLVGALGFRLPGERGIVLDRQRPADQVALDLVAGFVFEERELLLRSRRLRPAPAARGRAPVRSPRERWSRTGCCARDWR